MRVSIEQITAAIVLKIRIYCNTYDDYYKYDENIQVPKLFCYVGSIVRKLDSKQ